MSPFSSRVPSADPVHRRNLVSVVSLLVLTLVLAVVMFITLRSPLKDDIAWLLYVARRWIAGRELYIDLVEVNPPLIVWISAIPIAIGRWLDADPQLVAMPVFVALVLGCACWTARLLRPRGPVFARAMPVFAAIGMALLILPAADLGQREHLLVAAFLPYLALFARTLDRAPSTLAYAPRFPSWIGRIAGCLGYTASAGRGVLDRVIHRPGDAAYTDHALDRRHLPVVVAVAAGMLAGLGCALKPRYAAVFVALEAVALLRGLRPWRVMPLTAGFTLAGYAGLVAVLCPAYLQRAVPMALALYGATDVPFLKLLTDSTLLLCAEAVAIALLLLRQRLADRNLMLTLVVFAAASTFVCFIDGKDWYYHRLPAIVTTVLALLIGIVAEWRDPRPERRWTARSPLAAAFLMVAMFCLSAAHRLEPEAVEAVEPQQTAVDRLEQILQAEHARTYIAFSEWIALGFPVVNQTGVTWASRFDSMWALKGEVWRAGFDPSADQEWPIARWVSHDFIAGCPDIAVVDTRETTKYISVLSAADAAFARAWSRYRPIAWFDGLVVYRRGKSGCRDVWVAAESKPMAAAQDKSGVRVR